MFTINYYNILLHTIIENSNTRRPTIVDPSKIHQSSNLDNQTFVEALVSLEKLGYIELCYRNKKLVGIFITTLVPIK